MAEWIIEANDTEEMADGKFAVICELVRCKDCERLSNVRVAPKGERICLRYWCGKKEDGFCDEGERREE